MSSLGFSDILSLTQTFAIIAALIVTLYFSIRQIQNMTVDLETRVLNDIDEKMHHLVEIFIEQPGMIKMINGRQDRESAAELFVAYYVNYLCSHIYHMRQKRVLNDNEWRGWLQWMKNAYQLGAISNYWKKARMESWFDPAFRNFVNNELSVGNGD